MTEPTEPVPPSADQKNDEARPKRRAKSRVLRWIGIGFGVLVGILLLAVVVLYVRGRAALGGTHEITPPTVNVPTDSATVARGQHIALIHGCHDCHGPNLEGRVLADVAPFLIAPPNLTRGTGGVGSQYSAVDWDRAVRYGARPDGGQLLPMMPYSVYNRLNDADMAALAAYLSSRPAVNNEVPRSRAKFLGNIIFGISGGQSREGFDRPRPIIAPGPTAAYGAYLASTTCVGCHGERLQGESGRFKTPGLHGYGAMDRGVLTRALREGKAADGRSLDPEAMPWQAFRHMNDAEIAAIHAYLSTLGTPATR